MNILSELKEILSILDIPMETGVFSSTSPNEYIVLTPMADNFDYFADNLHNSKYLK